MNVCVSYAYFEPEKPERVIENLNFFMTEGIERFRNNKEFVMDYNLIIQGSKCSIPVRNMKTIRTSNTGFDLGAHRKVIDTKDVYAYDYFVFLNCGQRGPFLPAYWPESNHWFHVFYDKLKSQKKPGIVGPCIFFPRKKSIVLETWAFALSRDALIDVLQNTKVFIQHEDKKSAVINGENGLAQYLYEQGYGIDTLLLKYDRDKFWKDGIEHCDFKTNFCGIASRPFNYEGINIHPLETVFYKTYWRSTSSFYQEYNDPYEQRYTEWALREKEPRHLEKWRRISENRKPDTPPLESSPDYDAREPSSSQNVMKRYAYINDNSCPTWSKVVMCIMAFIIALMTVGLVLSQLKRI